MINKEVKAETYDEVWITNAWGEEGTEKLLQNGPIHPRPRVARAFKLAAIQPGMRVLDIACGRGEMPMLAALAGGYAIGLDYSPAVLKVAAEVKKARQYTFQEGGEMILIQADATNLPFADGSFDRITLLDIIEHLLPYQLEAMFNEVGRLLAPSGYAVIHTLPNRWVYEVGYRLARRLIPRLPKDPRGEIERKIHINEQDLPKLHAMLDDCSLKHRIWLEQQMPAQARWKARGDRYGDNRDRLYPMIASFSGRLLELISLTPAKLILSNDIYGLAWKPNASAPSVQLPLSFTERFVCYLGSKSKPDNRREPG